MAKRLLPPPRKPDPLFDDFVPPRLVSMLRRVDRRGDATLAQKQAMQSQLKRIDPRLEPLVDDLTEEGGEGCIEVFMDLIGPELAVGAALFIELLKAPQANQDLAWRLAEERADGIPTRGSAADIEARLLALV